MEHPNATDWQNRCERAEAECKELRERVGRIPAVFWFLRDRCEFTFTWRIYAAWKMLVAPNYMASAFVLFAHSKLQNTTTNGS